MEKRFLHRQPNTKCYYCGRPFYKPMTYLRRKSKHNFCSYECRGLWSIGKPCHTEKFKKELAERNKKRVWAEKSRKKARAKKNVCHTELRALRMSLKGKGRTFSAESIAKRSGKNHPFWKGGISFLPYSLEWTFKLKKQIRKRDKFVCQLCKKNGFVVHHIDYDKKNCNPENLITLCRRCHRKTNDNRKYWTKFFKNLIKKKGGEVI